MFIFALHSKHVLTLLCYKSRKKEKKKQMITQRNIRNRIRCGRHVFRVCFLLDLSYRDSSEQKSLIMHHHHHYYYQKRHLFDHMSINIIGPSETIIMITCICFDWRLSLYKMSTNLCIRNIPYSESLSKDHPVNM